MQMKVQIKGLTFQHVFVKTYKAHLLQIETKVF